MTLADAISPGWWVVLPGLWAAFVVTAANDDFGSLDGADLFLAFFPFGCAILARCLP